MHLTYQLRDYMAEYPPSQSIEPSQFAAAIEEDFRALVDVLSDGAIHSGIFDDQVLAQIAAARSAAERGLRLSRQLVDMTARDRTQGAH